MSEVPLQTPLEDMTPAQQRAAKRVHARPKTRVLDPGIRKHENLEAAEPVEDMMPTQSLKPKH